MQQRNRQIIKYLLNYFLILFLVVVACCPFVWQSYQSAYENVTRQSGFRLQEGINNLEHFLDTIYETGNLLRQDKNIRRLSRIHGELELPEYVYMNYGSEKLSSLLPAYGNQACASMLLFRHNDIFVSDQQVTESFSDYYGKFMKAGDMNVAEFREKLFQTQDSISLFSVSEFQYYDSGKMHTVYNPLICVQKINSIERINKVELILVVVIEYEQMMEWMVTEDMRDICLLNIRNDQKVPVFVAENEIKMTREVQENSKIKIDGNMWQLLEIRSEVYNLAVILGFPMSIISTQVAKIIGMLIMYAVIGLIVAVIMAVYLSYRQYRPIKELNERLQKSAIEKLILRGISTQEEAEIMEQFLEVPIEFFSVASIYISETEKQYSEVNLRIQEHLQHKMPNKFILVSSGFQEIIVLILLKRDNASHVQGIKSIFAEIARTIAEEQNIMLSIGISAIGNGIHNVSACYNQALQARRTQGQNINGFVEVYSFLQNHSVSDSVNIEEIQKLRNHLLSGDRRMIEQLFTRMMSKWRNEEKTLQIYHQQLFYFIRHVIWCTIGELSLPEESVKIPFYRSNCSLQEMLDEMKETCWQICNCIDEMKKSRNQKLKDNILQTMQKEYVHCELTAGIVCSKVGISEKYLYQFIKEQTGKTFAGYLEELRMGHAEKLLLGSDLNNAQIAEAAGIGSVNTLYRMFNKYKGLSPAAYKKAMQEKEEMNKLAE